eukprot:m.88509 g.88509  ORF g.88509 m.88509 type:complete len:295 (+) comp26205_c1_seq1:294-1178(+)
MAANPSVKLQVHVCAKYGWGCEFYVDGRTQAWAVKVTLGPRPDQCKIFVSNDRSPQTKKGTKQGKVAAATIALVGLSEAILVMESRPQKTLLELVGDEFRAIPIVDSCDLMWRKFWSHAPKIVGIDTEGNQRNPPVLVQIASEHMVILEAPKQNSGLSEHLQRLLNDNNILKVFCDNSSHKDKHCLGIDVPEAIELSGTNGSPIVDLEDLTSSLIGSTNYSRGLTKIVELSMPNEGYAIEKGDEVGRFAMIEQGFGPELRGPADLNQGERTYAALDAWATLLAWNNLKLLNTHH